MLTAILVTTAISNKSDGQSIRLNIISEGSELALEANGLFYELAYTHIKHPICL